MNLRFFKDSIIILTYFFVVGITSCNQDDEPSKNDTEDVEEKSEVSLSDTDYTWIAKTNLGNSNQLINLFEFKNFNQEPDNSALWSNAEILNALEALLYHKYQFQVGAESHVTYAYYDGELKSQTIPVNSSAIETEICVEIACEKSEDVLILQTTDYISIVDMNKGELDQLDNLYLYNNFNIDANSESYWNPEEIKEAINAVLLHTYGKEVEYKQVVEYSYYDGTEFGNRQIEVEVFETSEFDVYEYLNVNLTKTNDTKVFVHYMPWFASKDINGYWGSHWTMANMNPDIIVDGKRQIAAHYYPLIGPYSSKDPDLVEYHLLLMKLSGLDGVLIDWYGTYPVNDYVSNLENSNALITKTSEVGLDFGIVYEDRTTEAVVNSGKATHAVEVAKTDFNYIKDNYLSTSNYIQVDNKDLILTFTPIHIETGSEWQEIFEDANIDPVFLAIWGQSGDLGATGSGEYSWLSSTADDHLQRLEYFYQTESSTLDVVLGSAYPGFDDFYEEGGWGSSYGNIAYNQTSTLEATLDLATNNDIDYLQLVTWNDFGEGTMLEPTLEFGYAPLVKIQQFTGIEYDSEELELIYNVYDLRKNQPDNEVVQLKLDQIYYYIISLQLDRAKSLFDTIEN